MTEYVQTKFDSKSFNPTAFGKYVDKVPATRRSELIKSRALRGNRAIREAFSSQSGAGFATLPMAGRIGGAPLNYDGDTDITAQSTTTFERGVVVVGRAQAWTERDFSSDIAGGMDFMDNVARQVAEYWDGVDQETLLSVLKGVFSMTGAKNLEFVEGHTLDISGAEGEDRDGNPKSCVGPATLNTATQKACGDNKSAFSLVVMHSSVATNLENLRLLSYLKYTDRDGVTRPLSIGAWNGRTVLVDDTMPVEEVEESGAGYTRYTTYVLGEGAVDFEDIGAKVPYEMSRDAKSNGGEDTLYARQRKVFAPFGLSWTRKSQASLSPTDAELENGQNWSLVYNGESGAKAEYIDHKAIPIARILSRG